MAHQNLDLLIYFDGSLLFSVEKNYSSLSVVSGGSLLPGAAGVVADGCCLMVLVVAAKVLLVHIVGGNFPSVR